MGVLRTRWAAIGAAIAVSLGAGGIGLSRAAPAVDERPVFVAIDPCRLVDTRPGDANIGPRSRPLGANDTMNVRVIGSNGDCRDIPVDAVAAALNVTAIRPTAQSFLSVYPGDVGVPTASNLNWGAGDPPTANKVDVRLGSTGIHAGSINVTNSVGDVHVAVDLFGYYVDHTHPDIAAQLPATDGAPGYNTAVLGPNEAIAVNAIHPNLPAGVDSGYLRVTAIVNVFTGDPTGCPCQVAAFIGAEGEQLSAVSWATLGDQVTDDGTVELTIPVEALLRVTSPVPLIDVVVANDDDQGRVLASGEIFVDFVPRLLPGSGAFYDSGSASTERWAERRPRSYEPTP